MNYLSLLLEGRRETIGGEKFPDDQTKVPRVYECWSIGSIFVRERTYTHTHTRVIARDTANSPSNEIALTSSRTGNRTAANLQSGCHWRFSPFSRARPLTGNKSRNTWPTTVPLEISPSTGWYFFRSRLCFYELLIVARLFRFVRSDLSQRSRFRCICDKFEGTVTHRENMWSYPLWRVRINIKLRKNLQFSDGQLLLTI